MSQLEYIHAMYLVSNNGCYRIITLITITGIQFDTAAFWSQNIVLYCDLAPNPTERWNNIHRKSIYSTAYTCTQRCHCGDGKMPTGQRTHSGQRSHRRLYHLDKDRQTKRYARVALCLSHRPRIRELCMTAARCDSQLNGLTLLPSSFHGYQSLL
ncbi:hypothetical protein BD311DRAFT_164991 [Dichomitus squalens]|uniref:Uncharacterized protein n=1 Tax=Dichomitus squalens TaxID=114155 RepID=A0A4Q9M5C1_9APHY|nr:hypothetical protein BD311DRAFT_164991 [Dichomitus squalens]